VRGGKEIAPAISGVCQSIHVSGLVSRTQKKGKREKR